MKKNIFIFFIVIIIISNIFSDDNLIKFKPTEIVSIIQKNPPNGFITPKTQAFDWYYCIIGVLENNIKCAILIKPYSIYFGKTYGSKAIIINNEIYDKKYNKYNIKEKLKFALFSTWYYLSLLNSKIERNDFFDTDISVKYINKILKDKYQIKYILDVNNKSKYIFKIIDPINYDKLLFSDLKIN